jgi:hypothetical protein
VPGRVAPKRLLGRLKVKLVTNFNGIEKFAGARLIDIASCIRIAAVADVVLLLEKRARDARLLSARDTTGQPRGVVINRYGFVCCRRRTLTLMESYWRD